MNNPVFTKERVELEVQKFLTRISYSPRSYYYINTYLREFLSIVQRGKQVQYANSLSISVRCFAELQIKLPKWVAAMAEQFPEDERYAKLLFKLKVDTAKPG